MPIKSLESYLFERKLVNTSSIEILQNATIGIDVEHYLSRIYTFKKEQFLSAIGGVPSSLRDYIHSDLKVFKEFNIKPIFVIKGIDIQLQAHNLQTNELTPGEQHLENTWTKLNSRNVNYNYTTNDSFRVFTDPLSLRPMIHDLIKYFVEIGIDYIVCPYDASFQLSYLYHKRVIDSIYGSTDLLLTKVNKFILGMEFQSKDFRFIDKPKVLYELKLTHKQLLDLSIMVGCNLQPNTFPSLPSLPQPNPLQPYPQLSYFKIALDILYQLIAFNGDNQTDLYSYILSLNDQRCLDLYLKGHSAFRYIPVLNDEGFVTLYTLEMQNLNLLSEEEEASLVIPVNEEGEKKVEAGSKGKAKAKTIQIPNDVHDIISQRLPAEFYFYQSIGLAPIELLESITQGQLYIRPPLESGLSESYKKLINSRFYIDNLDGLFNLVTQLLARYYQVKKIKVNYWYKSEDLELNNRMIPPVSRRINHLFSVNPEVADFSLVNFFKNTKETYPKEQFGGSIGNYNEIISTALLRSLYLYGIIDEKTNEFNSYGKALKQFVQQNETKLDDTTLQELVLVMLLIQTKCFKLNDLQTEYNGVAKYFKDPSGSSSDVKLDPQESKHITLLARIFSIHRLQIAPINYQGPISRSLLNFRSHLKFISTNLIYTIQSCLIDLIVRQENNNVKIDFEDKADWCKLVDQLPFYKDLNNTLLGVVAEIYFGYSAKQSKLNQDLTKDQIAENSREQLLNSVYQITNPIFNINVHGVNSVTSTQFLSDFNKGVEFWGSFVELVKVTNQVDSGIISDDYCQSIVDTESWMKQFI
ncbi:hypothetical protein PSN45_000168 [Yamadazyma tenuis]|uniref:uncharacterized protein n=1 Tax=Candida tenuis TaxID=2315449 RepID=UPI0027AAD91D|nr:hypothetical protein PSN45_000168 [Yamadazyma tenuis]